MSHGLMVLVVVLNSQCNCILNYCNYLSTCFSITSACASLKIDLIFCFPLDDTYALGIFTQWNNFGQWNWTEKSLSLIWVQQKLRLMTIDGNRTLEIFFVWMRICENAIGCFHSVFTLHSIKFIHWKFESEWGSTVSVHWIHWFNSK